MWVVFNEPELKTCENFNQFSKSLERKRSFDEYDEYLELNDPDQRAIDYEEACKPIIPIVDYTNPEYKEIVSVTIHPYI